MARVVYRPVRKRRWFALGRVLAWVASDHLLVVSDRIFREIYFRIYWTDMQTMLLYSLPRPVGLMLGFEILCVAAAAVSAPMISLLWGSVFAAVFVSTYASWRLMQPNWACQISTELSTHRFALEATLKASRRIIEDLNTRVQAVQGLLPEVESRPQTSIPGRDGAKRRDPTLAVHVIAFVLGLLTPLSSALLVLYYGALIAVLFVQRDFQFPLAVRSATLMSHLLALFQLAWFFWLRFSLAVSWYLHFPTVWEFHVLRLLFSLFGLAAVYQNSLQSSRYQLKRSSVLGLS